MSRALLVLETSADRARATSWIASMPTGTRLEFKAPRRSLDQNSRMWAMLTECATQLKWHDRKLTPDDWKLLFLDALKRENQIVPNLDGTGFVNIGQSSSDLSKSEMSDLIELIFEFGARHGVKFKETRQETAA